MTTEDLPPEASRYYRGTILKIRYGSGTGTLLTGNGRKVPFETPFVELVGIRTLDELREGMSVGFDLGWTSRGLWVTRIRVD